MKEFVDLFVTEAREHLERLEAALLSLEKDPKDAEAMNVIFRAAHTVKGGAATVGLPRISELAHGAESLLDEVRKGRRAVDRPLMDLLLRARDALQEGVEAVAAGRSEPDFGKLVAALESALPQTRHPPQRAAASPPSAPAAPAPGHVTIRVEIDPASPMMAPRSMVVLRSIGQLGHIVASAPTMADVEAGRSPGYVEAQVETDRSADEIRAALSGLIEVTRIDVVTSASQPPAPPPGVPVPPPSGSGPGGSVEMPRSTAMPKASSIRVATAQLETIINTVGELVIHKARLVETGRTVENPALQDVVNRLDRLTTDLYQNVLGVRMLPLSMIYDRFPRMVRELASQQSKEIELVTRGKDIELDRSVIEGLSDPLVHLFRNALDHGLESAAEREKGGKPRKGTITFDARREQNRVIVEISDDGRGIDPERIKGKAVEKGLITADEANKLSVNDAYLLLCRPGFSTAHHVTKTSGRGVGLDVVKNWVESVGGSLQITSQVGVGTKFGLRLPLTLAILKALIVRIGPERYVVPIDTVESTVDLESTGIQTIHGREVFVLGDEVIPILRLSRLLNVPGPVQERFAVVVERHGRKAALTIEEVIGQQEVVVKALSWDRIPHRGVGGATILGDGNVALILNVAGLLEAEAVSVRV